METPIYTVIFRSEPKDTPDDEWEEIIRINFASPEVISRVLPGIIHDRLHVVWDAAEACGKTVEEVCAFLADRKNMCKFLDLGNGVNAVCAYSVVYN